jgi:uncharacterized membrane protein YidH (DUF202 family)
MEIIGIILIAAGATIAAISFAIAHYYSLQMQREGLHAKRIVKMERWRIIGIVAMVFLVAGYGIVLYNK